MFIVGKTGQAERAALTKTDSLYKSCARAPPSKRVVNTSTLIGAEP